jgi:twitching motility protein PilT
MFQLTQLLKLMIDQRASDLHVAVGTPPQLRIDGRLFPIKTPPLTAEQARTLCYEVLPPDSQRIFEQESELDFAVGIEGLSRFRVNLFMQRGTVAGAFRAIPHSVPAIDQLGLPAAVVELASRPRGLVLVTGPTGSGKSTTLAALIDKINAERHEHIITVEDPIEFLHENKRCVVSQREVGPDTRSFGVALKHILRQDPDVVLIGEMRDLETVEAALRVSETGHLVFATLHTNNAIQTINRILDVFPAEHQAQVRTQLSFVLEGIVCQDLVPRANGPGRALAMEVLIPTPGIRTLIRDDKLHQIHSAMQMGQGKHQMQTMNQSLASLVHRGAITAETALSHTSEPEELRLILGPAAGGVR